MSEKYKSTVAIVLKNGVQVSSKSSMSEKELWTAFDNSKDNNTMFRIEVGDEYANIIKILASEISLISIMKYVDEKEAASRNGLIVPVNTGAIRRVQ